MAVIYLVFLPTQDGQMLKCSHLSASDVTISCTKPSSLNYTISVTIVDGECQCSLDKSDLWGH